MGINKDLGLPFGDGMEKVAICFDVDGTLVTDKEQHLSTISLLSIFKMQKWKNVDIIVWSGGGQEHAEHMYRDFISKNTSGVKFYSKLQYEDVRAKYAKIIAIDDVQNTRLGDVNLIVRNK